MCKKECHITGDCPFSFTESSEYAQNMGCLPTPFDIIEMRVMHGKTWACHSSPTKPCQGALKFMKSKGIECKVVDNNLLTEGSHWNNYCSANFDATIFYKGGDYNEEM